MEKVIVNFGENKVSAGEGFSGNGTSASPLGFTGEIQHTDKRTLLWETTGTPYNTSIQLNEPITHYNQIMIYGSGVENEAGGYHTSKNVYQTQPRPINAGPWAFSLWNLTGYRCAYTLGADMILSGNSGYIGSSFANGIPQGSTAFAGYKWTGADANKMLMPWRIYGIGKKRVNTLTIINGDHGTVSASVLTGCEYDTVTLSNTPDEDWYFSGYNITGATLTGNKFTFGNSDVIVEGVWSDQPQIKTLTLQTDGHGSLTANKVTGYEGDTVTLTRTPSARYNNSAYSVTGGTINGNTFTFGNQDATAKAWFSAASYSAYRLMITGMAAILSYPNRYCQLQEYGLGYSNGGPYYGPNYWTITSTAMSGTYWTSNRKLAQLFDGNTTTEAGKWDAYNFTAARVDFRTKNSNRVVPQKVGMVMAYYNANYTGAKPTTDLYGYNNDRGTYELLKHINATALPNGNTASYTASI